MEKVRKVTDLGAPKNVQFSVQGPVGVVTSIDFVDYITNGVH